MPEDVPTDEVLKLKVSGQSPDQITQSLQLKGYKPYQISEALNQAEIKQGVEINMPETPQMPVPGENPSGEMQPSMLDQEAPNPPAGTPEIPVPQPAAPKEEIPAPVFEGGASPFIPSGGSEAAGAYEDVQALVEEIIDEKWQEVSSSIGDLAQWKSQIGDETESIKQELLRLTERFDRLQAAMVGKVDEYGKNVKDIGTDMKALEQVFGKILEPLTSNIKELNRITERVKKKK